MTTRSPTSFAAISQRPNPFVNPGPWGKVYIGGALIPGTIESINGARKPEEWDHQKPTEKSNASSVWKGTANAKSIKIKTKLLDQQQFDAYYDLRDTLRPKQGTKPPALAIVNPKIQFNGITRVAEVDIGDPDWNPSGGYWVAEIEVCEFNPPKKANTGVAAPAGAAGGALASAGLGSYVSMASSLSDSLKGALGAAKAAA